MPSNLKMSVSPAFWWAMGGRHRWTVLRVSDGELRRLEMLRDVDRGILPVRAAAQLLGRSERQVWRLLKAFRSDGVAGLISKKRGRPSNRRTTASVRTAALWIVRHNYADFGPTLAAEKLAAEHGAPRRPDRAPVRRPRQQPPRCRSPKAHTRPLPAGRPQGD